MLCGKGFVGCNEETLGRRAALPVVGGLQELGGKGGHHPQVIEKLRLFD